MNTRKLRSLGVPDYALTAAIQGLQSAISSNDLRGKEVQALIPRILEAPADYTEDPHFAAFAKLLLEDANEPVREPAPYQTWGTEIDQQAHGQMRDSCAVPMAVAGALMPDAHVGYGLPIGGVLALDGAVIPYAVGVDIACRMKLSILDVAVPDLANKLPRFEDALNRGTRFGVGSEHQTPADHAVLDEDWSVSRVTREYRDKARRQLGTSGSGNHFVEFGVFSLPEDSAELGLKKGEYVSLLSHSGSRGTGAAVCDTYSNMARARLSKKHEHYGRLAWLEMNTQEGQDYWAAMNLMGNYAAANHDVIHRLVSKLLGARIIAGVENHHNFAWKEMHQGRELIVHRKGATPAGAGVLGVIPGSMASPAYIVKGKGNAASLNSAAHGAGRRMSRTQAREKYNFRSIQKDLATKGVRVISAGADEVPYVYKDIEQVMHEQQDLVEVIARFDPRIVKMSDDGRNED